jgi:P27 family predicted phage terminase small subunit
MRGRKPKSTVIKLLTGNPGGRKLNKNEPKYSKLNVTPPHFLDALALEEWNRICSELHATGMLTTADRATFAAYCVAYSRWVKAERALAAMLDKSEDSLLGGMAFKTHRGNLSINPIIRVANASMDLMLKAASEFGLTPASRSRAGSGTSNSGYDDGYDPSAGNW